LVQKLSLNFELQDRRCLQMLRGLRTLAAALRVLYLPHLRYDCMYSTPQLYPHLIHLELSPDTGDGLFSVFCAVHCKISHSNASVAGLRSINESLQRTGFDPPFRNTCQLVATTCAYLRVLLRFIRCCRNHFASLRSWSGTGVDKQ